MVTKQRDGPGAAANRAGPAVGEALKVWLVEPYSGGSSVGSSEDPDGVVINGPDATRFAVTLALDADPEQPDAINLSSDMFYWSPDRTRCLLIDSPDVRKRLEEEVGRNIERISGSRDRDRGLFQAHEVVSQRYTSKAHRALAAALPHWRWLRQKLGSRPSIGLSETELIITTSGNKELRFSVTFDDSASFAEAGSGKTVLRLTLDLFQHPAARDWEFRQEPNTWLALQKGLEPCLSN